LHATKPIYFALISPDVRYSGPGTEVRRYSSGPGYGMPAGVPQEGLGGWAGGVWGGRGKGPPPQPRSCHADRGRPAQSCPGRPQAP
jgi:hypothetical protein